MRTQKQQFERQNGVRRTGKQLHLNATEQVRMALEDSSKKKGWEDMEGVGPQHSGVALYSFEIEKTSFFGTSPFISSYVCSFR